VRQIGVLFPGMAADLENQNRIAAFQRGLHELGWTDGRNLRIHYRWGGGSADHIHNSAAELVALAPEVIYAVTSATVGPLLDATRTIPIVFAAGADPVGAGYVDSLARPGGNVTGFLLFEYGIRASQADSAGVNASDSVTGSQYIDWCRAVGRDPSHGTIDWS
jgi:putative ABC transport system substrate-binding protein